MSESTVDQRTGKKARKPFLQKRKAARSDASTGDSNQKWLVLVVDDDPVVHQVTKMTLAGLEFDQRGLRILSAYSAKEAQSLVQEHPDIAVALVDVVMETDHAGLDLVVWMREHVNQAVRILLRTGQAGMASQVDVAKNYDIDGYLEKSLVSAGRLKAQLYIELRAYKKSFR